jgi:hypothetical protein
LRLSYSHRMTAAEQRRMRELVFQHQALFKERWREYFSGR